jgi:hypothetical protein
MKADTPLLKAHARPSCGSQLGVACRTAGRSLYFWSCIVYLIYTGQILAIDYCNAEWSDCSSFGWTSYNRQFIGAGVRSVSHHCAATFLIDLACWLAPADTRAR